TAHLNTLVDLNGSLRNEPLVLSFSPGDNSLGGHFRTNSGSRIALRPTGDSGLKLAARKDLGPTVTYLEPSGSFVMTPEDIASKPRIVCGLSGSEYVSFQSGDPIKFEADRAAQIANGKLTEAALTAWVSFPQSASEYSAQPQDGELYGDGSGHS